MKIFVTGATGFIGSAVVQELLRAGHQVSALVRSDAQVAGAEVVRGSIEDLDVLKRAAANADGVVHAAFMHNFSDFAKACAVDQAAITAIGEVMVGKPFAITTGTPSVPGRVATEADSGDRTSPVAKLRGPAEDLALELAKRGVRSMTLRMPRAVHGAAPDGWRGGLVGRLVDIAREKKVSAYVGDGAQRWPAVHRLDAARLYRLAIENGTAGSRYHAIGDEGVSIREIAEAIGKKLGVPVVSKSPADVQAHFGFYGAIANIDQPASARITTEQLAWKPTQPGLLADFATNA